MILADVTEKKDYHADICRAANDFSTSFKRIICGIYAIFYSSFYKVVKNTAWHVDACKAVLFFAGDRIKMYEIIQSSILEMTAKSDDHYLDGKRCQKRWFR